MNENDPQTVKKGRNWVCVTRKLRQTPEFLGAEAAGRGDRRRGGVNAAAATSGDGGGESAAEVARHDDARVLKGLAKSANLPSKMSVHKAAIRDVRRGKLSPPPDRVAMLCLTDIISLASPTDRSGR